MQSDPTDKAGVADMWEHSYTYTGVRGRPSQACGSTCTLHIIGILTHRQSPLTTKDLDLKTRIGKYSISMERGTWFKANVQPERIKWNIMAVEVCMV